MKWFYDLRTTYKFLLSFGVLAVMLAGVGFVGLSGIVESNTALTVAYERDMKGVESASRADIERQSIARALRQGMLVHTAAAREAGLRDIDEAARKLEAALRDLKATLVVRENIERTESIEHALPEYLRLVREAMQSSEKDAERALVVLERAGAIGNQMSATLDQITASKQHVAEKAQADAADHFARSRNLVIGVTLLAILFAVMSTFLADRGVAAPLTRAVALLERVASGDLSGRLDVETKDEVGQLGSALNKSLESIRTTLLGVQEISTQVSSASSQLASAAEQISGGAQAQAASLEETAASLEEISSTVKQNADNAQQASQLANGARDAAERGGQVVESAVSAMSEITKSSKKIADIITTID